MTSQSRKLNMYVRSKMSNIFLLTILLGLIFSHAFVNNRLSPIRTHIAVVTQENEDLEASSSLQVAPVPTGLLVPAMTLIGSPLYVNAADLGPLIIARPILDVFVNIMSLLFICRIVMSWYPNTDTSKFPYNAISWPTEPLLKPAREVLPPAFGVDISAIVWVGLLSFVREVFTGNQGILTLLEKS